MTPKGLAKKLRGAGINVLSVHPVTDLVDGEVELEHGYLFQVTREGNAFFARSGKDGVHYEHEYGDTTARDAVLRAKSVLGHTVPLTTGAVYDGYMKQFLELATSLSPENLTCDGELSRGRVNQKYRELTAEWKKLETAIGRLMPEEEVWNWYTKKHGRV